MHILEMLVLNDNLLNLFIRNHRFLLHTWFMAETITSLSYAHKKLKIILSHDFDAAALQNMDQLTSRESSATFTDQDNMDPLNGSPTLEYIACIDRLVSTPGFTEPQNAAPAGRPESQVFLFCYLRYIH